jgi:hypothetical protein
LGCGLKLQNLYASFSDRFFLMQFYIIFLDAETS